MPGLIDTHVHASQFVNAGTGLDLTLLDWLNKYTFPTEAMYSDLQFAEKAYTACVVRYGKLQDCMSKLIVQELKL